MELCWHLSPVSPPAPKTQTHNPANPQREGFDRRAYPGDVKTPQHRRTTAQAAAREHPATSQTRWGKASVVARAVSDSPTVPTKFVDFLQESMNGEVGKNEKYLFIFKYFRIYLNIFKYI